MSKTNKADKRLNEVIRVQKLPSNFVMLDKGFLENPELSWKAKGILAYLLSKPDNWKVIVKDLVNHATDGKSAVYSGLNELKGMGHYQKNPVRDNDGKRISHWEGTISEVPMDSLVNTPSSLLPNFQEIDNQDIDNQYIENRERSNNDLKDIDLNNNEGSVGETPPAPAGSSHGEFSRVWLESAQYNALLDEYGSDTTTAYIERVDRHKASTGKRYKSDYATIKKWIDEDSRKQSTPMDTKPVKGNPFFDYAREHKSQKGEVYEF